MAFYIKSSNTKYLKRSILFNLLESGDKIKNIIDQIIIQYKNKSNNFVLISKPMPDKNKNFSKLKIKTGRGFVDSNIRILVVSR
jgi:hypothetical protein